MRRKRRLLPFFTVGAILVCAAFIRVGYKSVGSGGYIYVDIAVPWNR